MILALLPVIVLLLLTLYLADCDGFQGDRRSAFLAALVILGVLIMVSTEALSLFDAFRWTGLIIVWGTATGAAAGLVAGRRHLVWDRAVSSGSRQRGRSYLGSGREPLLVVLLAVSAAFLLPTAFSGWMGRKGASTMPKSHRSYAPEFRKRIIELVRKGRTPEELARRFEPSAQAIRNWVKQAGLDAGERTDGLTTEERDELRRLRCEVRQLREERAVLSKAAAWCARETHTIPPKDSSA